MTVLLLLAACALVAAAGRALGRGQATWPRWLHSADRRLGALLYGALLLCGLATLTTMVIALVR